MRKKYSDIKFSISSKTVATILGVIGLIFTIGSILWNTNIDETKVFYKVVDTLLAIVGQTLIGSCAISLLLEISTLRNANEQSVEEGCKRVLDTLYGNETEYFNGLSIDRNIQSRVQLLVAALNQKSGENLFNAEFVEKSALLKFENLIMDSYVTGIICNKIDRKIRIKPVIQDKGTTYCVYISEYHNLTFLNDEAYSHLRNHRFRFISKKQIDSFELTQMVVNGEDYKDSLNMYVKKEDKLNEADENAVGNRVFDYVVTVQLPKQPKTLRNLEYRIEYKYKNYEMGTYLTSALNYPTYNINEVYSLIGEQKDQFIIHGFSHFPYHSQPKKKIYASRNSSSVIQIQINNDWQLPGSGSSVIVRQRNPDYTEILN